MYRSLDLKNVQKLRKGRICRALSVFTPGWSAGSNFSRGLGFGVFLFGWAGFGVSFFGVWGLTWGLGFDFWGLTWGLGFDLGFDCLSFWGLDLTFWDEICFRFCFDFQLVIFN